MNCPPRPLALLAVLCLLALPTLGDEPRDPIPGNYALKGGIMITIQPVAVELSAEGTRLVPREGSRYQVLRVERTRGVETVARGVGTIKNGQLEVEYRPTDSPGIARLVAGLPAAPESPMALRGSYRIHPDGQIAGALNYPISHRQPATTVQEVGARQEGSGHELHQLESGASLRLAVYLLEGSNLQLQGRHAEAIEHYTRAIAYAPRFAPAYSARAHARSAAGDHSGALEDYTRAIELDPLSPQARCDRGLALLARARARNGQADFREIRQEIREAIMDLELAVELFPAGSREALPARLGLVQARQLARSKPV